MFRYVLVLLLIAVSMGWSQSRLSPENVSATLMRAEAVYFEARFKDAIDLLLPLDAELQDQQGRTTEKTNVKLQLAVAHVGLNQTAEAKMRFSELYDLDPEYSLDPLQYAPKVLTLFQEARSERSGTRCQRFCEQAARDLNSGRTDEVISRLGQQPGCACMLPITVNAADLVYKQGLEAYKQNNLAEALKKLRTVLTASPEHELARQYIDLIRNTIGLAVDRILLEWRKQFDAGDFGQAAASYRQLLSLNFDEKGTQAVEQTRVEYRKALSSLVESWNRACAANDPATMNTLLNQATQLLPEPSMSQGLLDQITTCTAPACLQLSSPLAMSRLRLRVNPQISSSLRAMLSLNARAKVTIDKIGNVTVNSVESGSVLLTEALKAALEGWKFYPAIMDGQARCVEADLPIVVN